MKKKYVLLVLIIVISITLIVSFNNKSNTKLDEVKLNEKDSEMFAIMLEQEDQTYVESDSNEWPDYKYKFNKELSGCIDKNGEKIKEEILTFDEGERKATVETSKTSYCYLYFDKLTAPGTKLSGYPNLSYDLKGGMYRYQGTSDVVDNNYICFGTTDKQDCINNPDIYMYRIIGIVGEDCTNKDTQLCDDTVSKDMIKIIKQTPLKEGSANVFQWHTGYQGDQYADILWSSSSLKQRLNGESSSSTNIFLNSNNSLYSYMKDTNWTNKIVSKNWYEGDIHYDYTPSTALEMFKQEHGISNATFYRGNGNIQIDTWKQSSEKIKIGLLSVSDYYWSISSDGIDCRNGEFSKCMESWIYLNNNEKNLSGDSSKEWTISRVGRFGEPSSFYYAYSVIDTGFTNFDRMGNAYSARPVFYLDSNITLTGTGIMNDINKDPFIITN